MQTVPPPGSFPPGTNPLRQQPPPQQGNAASTNPFRPAPNQPLQPGNQPNLNAPVYRPSTATSPPPRGQNAANFAPPPVTRAPRQAPPQGPPPRVTNPPPFSGARPGATYPGPSHAHSNSLDSNVSSGSAASSATATSTRPLNPNPPQRQNTAFSKPTLQNPDPREKGAPGGGGYYSSGGESGAAQTPYMNMLLSLDRIPRMHNILVSFYVWILLAGFVIIPGSFTSVKRKQENETVQLPISTGAGTTGADGSGEKLALTPANTAAMVIGFVCIVAGTFGSAWLALRWRRNYVWLLNKLYLPLILNALAGLLATVTSVYTQQAGEWRPQAVTTAVVEAVILVFSIVLFFVYNYWLLRRVRSDHEEKREKKEKKKNKKKRRGFLSRFRRARKKPPIAAGSVV
ncbi:hypothetical protein C8A01DRAFT_38055 [Parachaetomium inaequale]|uniref:Uncharacterized protein n=1 Tax=Parachaetomium inaequale TaxID=2588326 RepID=A0AAN6PBP8_9PEZI|nr:hypothetical protein C8A01DRAFT_38055 [Parachaetomium inaequale]